MFLVMKIGKNIQFMHQKLLWRKTYWSSIDRKRKQKILILSCIIILYIVEICFFHYCLQAFSTEEILKCLIKDFFKINGKQWIIMPKKGKYVKFKNYEIKLKSPFIIKCRFWKYFSGRRKWKVKSRRVLCEQI